MRKRRTFLAVFAVMVAVAFACWTSFSNSEPSYEGKTLSDWAVAMRDGPNREYARRVIHQIGPNSLPLLLQWLQREDHPTFKGSFYNSRIAVENWLISHKVTKPHPISYPFDAKESYRSLGLLTFEELGSDARAVIPALVQMLGEKRPKPDELSPIAGMAYLSLIKMSPDSVEPLIHCLTNSNEQTRILAASALGNIGTNATAALPALELWLHDKQLHPRLVASEAIGKIGGDPRLFIPMMIDSLQDTNADELGYELNILVRFTNDAKAAVPRLLEMLTNTSGSGNLADAANRNDLLNALKEIAPDALGKADADQ